MIEEAAIAPNESPCAQPGGGGPLTYAFDRTEFWRAIPAWRDVDAETFGDFRWQQRNSVTSIQGIQEALGELAKPALIADIEAGLLKTPMNVRLTPYIFSVFIGATWRTIRCAASFCRSARSSCRIIRM